MMGPAVIVAIPYVLGGLAAAAVGAGVTIGIVTVMNKKV